MLQIFAADQWTCRTHRRLHCNSFVATLHYLPRSRDTSHISSSRMLPAGRRTRRVDTVHCKPTEPVNGSSCWYQRSFWKCPCVNLCSLRPHILISSDNCTTRDTQLAFLLKGLQSNKLSSMTRLPDVAFIVPIGTAVYDLTPFTYCFWYCRSITSLTTSPLESNSICPLTPEMRVFWAHIHHGICYIVQTFILDITSFCKPCRSLFKC